MLCSTITTVRPARTRPISSTVRSTSSTPIPAVGSSSSSRWGSSARARASSRARLRPYGRLPACSWARPARPTRSSSSRPRGPKRSRVRRERQGERPRLPPDSSASSRCSRQLARSNRLVVWNDRATPSRAIRSGGRPVTSRPATSMLPPLGRRNPVSRLNRVVFPAPFGPTRACTVPAVTSRSTGPTARKPPKVFVSRRVRSTVAGGPVLVSVVLFVLMAPSRVGVGGRAGGRPGPGRAVVGAGPVEPACPEP